MEIEELDKHETLRVHLHKEIVKHRIPKLRLKLSNFQVIAGAPSSDLNFSPSRIFWHSFKETTGTTKAAFQITDGNGGPIMLDITLSAGESTRDFFGQFGLCASRSLYFKIVTGSVEGMVAGVLEEDYQADYERVEVLNYPGELIEVDKQSVAL